MRRITINLALIGLLIALTTATAQAPSYYISAQGVTFYGAPNAQGQIDSMAQLIIQPQWGGILALAAPIPGDPSHTQDLLLTPNLFLIGDGRGQTTTVPYLKPDGSTGAMTFSLGVLTRVQ
jgi:hypothetical protein